MSSLKTQDDAFITVSKKRKTHSKIDISQIDKDKIYMIENRKLIEIKPRR